MSTIQKLSLVIVILISGCRSVAIEQPAQPQPTIIPASPGPAYIWIGDSWAWDNRSRVYVYQQGRWAQPKKSRAVWVNGHWRKVRGGWKYAKGYWKRR